MEATLSEVLDMSSQDNEEDDEDNDGNDNDHDNGENQERNHDREGLEQGGTRGARGSGGGGSGGVDRLRVDRRALKSLRRCRREHSNTFSRACALLLRRDWIDMAHASSGGGGGGGVAAIDISGKTVNKKHHHHVRYSTRDVGTFVRLHISWAPSALTLLQVCVSCRVVST